MDGIIINEKKNDNKKDGRGKKKIIIPDNIVHRAKEMYLLGCSKQRIIRNIGIFMVDEKEHTLNQRTLERCLV